MCLEFLYKIFMKYFSFLEELREISQMPIGVHIKYLLSLSDLNGTWTFSTNFQEVLKYQISWKSL